MSDTTLADRMAAVQRAFEFMLAYAAQGRKSETEGGTASGIRELLEEAQVALDGLAATTADGLGIASSAAFGGIVEVLKVDARKAHSMIGLVLAQPAISSQLVDNLNASVHLRALLTDLFVISEAQKSAAGA